jgi:glycolate dehydrogenase FAD-binding subunit
VSRRLTPTSFDEAAAALADAATAGRSVRAVGGATKLDWGSPMAEPDLEISTASLDRIVEHNAGDLTAVLEAGVPLAPAQRRFASAGQMLALDPFLGPGQQATIGGIVATADSGPLRHRYGAPRDLILGMTVALSDGTIARSGGKVIKNVAGYDVAKLFCGSFGTLGLILSVSLRLHPLPEQMVTTLGVSSDPERLAGGARALAKAPLELEALDLAWRRGRGGILARCGGVRARARAERSGALLRAAGLESVEIATDDAELWARQRAGQRSATRALMRVATAPSALAAMIRAAEACGGTLVARAALGHSFVELDPDALAVLGEQLPRRAAYVLLDAPPGVREEVDPWGPLPAASALGLMRRIKDRFDPAHACNPGVFVGGI